MAHNVRVSLREGESQEELIKRFEKAVRKSGVLGTVRSRRYFVSRSEKRRLARQRATRQNRGR